MNDLKDYDISFIGLKDGSHRFEYVIDKAFFEFFEYEDFYSSKVNVQLNFLKKPTMFELDFHVSGEVEVACDVTNELYFQPIDNELNLIVKFGDEFNDENEELLVIPHGEFKLNVAQYIYEGIVLRGTRCVVMTIHYLALKLKKKSKILQGSATEIQAIFLRISR